MNKQKYFYLNVDGFDFQSSIDTIKNIPIIASYIDNANDYFKEDIPGYSQENRLFLDRDSIEFQNIYAFIQYGDKNKTTLELHKDDFIYYGITEDVDDVQDLKQKDANIVNFEVFNLLNNPTSYYVSACGMLFTTTKDRLKKSHYFKII